jgi:hypothetical protein
MRVDHLVGDKDRFFYTWHYYDSKANENETVLPKEISANSFRKPNTNTLMRGSWDHTFSPNLLNNLNLGYNNITSDVVCVDAAYAGSVPKIGGVPDNAFPPIIRMQGFEQMGCNGGFNQDRPSFIGNDLLSWVKGKHTLKFGVEYRNQQVNNQEYGSQSGNFNFSNLNTGLTNVTSGSSVASFLLGTVSSGNVTLRTQGSQYATAHQLSMQATPGKSPPKSAIMASRWVYPSVTEKHDILSFFDPKGTYASYGRPGTLAFARIYGALYGTTTARHLRLD